jgi:hypothetical protein
MTSTLSPAICATMSPMMVVVHTTFMPVARNPAETHREHVMINSSNVLMVSSIKTAVSKKPYPVQ